MTYYIPTFAFTKILAMYKMKELKGKTILHIYYYYFSAEVIS